MELVIRVDGRYVRLSCENVARVTSHCKLTDYPSVTLRSDGSGRYVEDTQGFAATDVTTLWRGL